MPAASAGKPKRPAAATKRKKGGTDSTRQFHFESFNDRIAKLTINPVSRARRQDVDAQDSAATTSHFRSSLDNWKDMNLSEHFSKFVREVDTLCDSLPQILHYQERIVAILLEYLSATNPLSLEPLLSLVSALVHDLGHRFEPYFARTLATVRDVATASRDVEVLEWSFTALAWMFKYLSRLLVPDLRPTFEIVAPLLGRAPQKPYISRFAAEAMSFLIRKAASRYTKDPLPLSILFAHIMQNLEELEERQDLLETYEHGIMALLADSIKGVNHELHSSGGTVITAVLGHVAGPAGSRIALGMIVNVLHHTTSETSGVVLEILNQFITSKSAESKNCELFLAADLLFHMATLRDGNRIANWEPLIRSNAHLRACHPSFPPTLKTAIQSVTAAIFARAPLPSILNEVRPFVEALTLERNETASTTLAYLLITNPKRFKDLIMPYLRRYVEKRPDALDEVLYFLTMVLSKIGAQLNPIKHDAPLISENFLKGVFEPIDTYSKPSDLSIYRQNACVTIASIAPRNLLLDYLAKDFEDCLIEGLSNSTNTRFFLGNGLEFLLNSKISSRLHDASQILGAISSYYNCPAYIDNLTDLCESNDTVLSTSDYEDIIRYLLPNLHSPSATLRKASLRLLNKVHEHENQGKSLLLDTALKIEDVPIDLQAPRKITLHISQLSGQYAVIGKVSWLRRALTHYMFGLLTHPMTDVWPAAIDLIKVICDDEGGEANVSSLLSEWLSSSAISGSPELSREACQDEEDGAPVVSEFQCTKSESAKREIEKLHRIFSSPAEHLEDIFNQKHRSEPPLSTNARLQSLRVLKSIPWLAEKKSRLLVPHFVHCFPQENLRTPNGFQADSSIPQSSRQERLAVLDLFAAFQNPKVLYRSQDVYETLLSVLKSNEAEFQKRAFKAILTWKQPSIVAHQESFNIVLDDARFRDGILQLTEALQNETLDSSNRMEAMPVFLRILFGRMTAGSKHSDKNSQKSRRHAVFDALGRFEDDDLKSFLEISLGNVAVDELENNDGSMTASTKLLCMPHRQKLGILTVAKDMIRFYGDRILPLVPAIANLALFCSEQASRELHDQQNSLEKQTRAAVLEDIRHTGFQTIVTLFERLACHSLEVLVPRLFDVFVNSRGGKLAEENSQGISALLKLFSAWALNERQHKFFLHSLATALQICDILNERAAKDDVKVFVLEKILLPFFSIQLNTISQGSDIGSFLEYTLQSCHSMLQLEQTKQVEAATIELVTSIASHVSERDQAKSLLRISCHLLEQPPGRVSPKTKSDILGIIEQITSKIDITDEADLSRILFDAIAYLFSYFKDRDNRLKLCRIFDILSLSDSEIALTSKYCSALNAFSKTAVDEPDFDRRREGYESLVGLEGNELSAKQWTPIIFNLLFFIKDTDELGVGSNACFALCAFIKRARNSPDLLDLLKTIVLPSLGKGVLEPSEEVRKEYITVLATLVREHPSLPEVSDLTVLLMDNDDEANIFNNLLHIQQHRRIRALRRLATPQISNNLTSTNVAHILIPLIEHFVISSDDDSKVGDLTSESINAIGALASALKWQQARGLLMKYLRLIFAKPTLEKSTMKLIGIIVDSIANAVNDKEPAPQESPGVETNGLESSYTDAEQSQITFTSTLSRTISDRIKLSEDVTNNLLPPLAKFLRHKDEAVVSMRVPVALAAIKLVMLLPAEEIPSRVAPILTDVSHVLRSRTAESRDLCRKTLAEIARVIGAPYFGFILKELRGALQRGYQLHVLSFTMHTLLVEAGPSFPIGGIDHCLPNATAIIMDDIFGAAGLEKDADEYSSQMKEVKQNKSFDSMELLAKLVSLERLSALIRPIQALLREKLDLKSTKKVDELLRRISVGLLKNQGAEDRRVLIFCYELIQSTYKQSNPASESRKAPNTARYILNLRGAKANQVQTGLHFEFKIKRFAFDLVRLILQKFDSLKTSTNLAGFMPAIGDAILDGEDEVQTSALRFLASIMKVPLDAIDADGPVYVSAAVDVIKNTTSNDSEMAQAALKLIGSALRERENIEVHEDDVAFLLKRLRPELDRSSGQGLVFNLLKSIVARNIVIPEVYEIMDVISTMMVTSQSRESRNMAQAAYFQFLLNYPQGAKRLAKQLTFLRKNLDYPHVEGRKSVLESIHRLLTKVNGALQQQVIATFFEPLVLTIINDDAADCRKMAGLLLGVCFAKANTEESSRIAVQIKRWMTQEENLLLTRAAFQLYALWIEQDPQKIENSLSQICTRLTQVIQSACDQASNEDWELLFAALQLLAKLVEHFPQRILSIQQSQAWELVRRCAAYPHAWIKQISATLLGNYLLHFMGSHETSEFPLTGPNGLKLEVQEVYILTRRSLRALQSPKITTELADRTIQNLAVLAKLSPPYQYSHASEGEVSADEGTENALGDESVEQTDSIVEIILKRLSQIIRSEPVSSKAIVLVSKTAALRLCRALCEEIPIATLQPLLSTILHPLHHLTDPTIPIPFSIDDDFKRIWKENVSAAHDIIDVLQGRVGGADYIKQMSNVQAAVKARREERRMKRRIESVATPEKALKEKQRKHDRKKERRKEKTGMYRERRLGL